MGMITAFRLSLDVSPLKLLVVWTTMRSAKRR